MTHELPLLADLLILLLAALPIAFLAHRLRLPVIIGFMLTGIMIGPSGLGLIKNIKEIELLAEIGVALLLFSIGLEFSLERLREMKRLVLGGGGLQVVLTVLLTLIAAIWAGRSARQALFFGFLIALSSTAIVLKTYFDRQEIDTLQGRAIVGILLFQDLCIVPMMLLIPILSGQEGSSFTNVAITLGTAAAVVAGIVFAARTVVPYLLFQVVRLRSSEVFIGFVVLISLGTAWLTAFFGLSMALGAFIAGLVLSESEYCHQIVSDVLPFRDVFNSLFFVSIGMLLSLSALANNLSLVLLVVGVIIVAKALIAALVAGMLRHSLRLAAIIGLGLAQVGEFSFILAKAGETQGLLPTADYQIFLAASILSMIATPILIAAAPKVALLLQTRILRSSFEIKDAHPEITGALENHIIIVGYGVNGQHLATVLSRANTPYVVLELNAETVRSSKNKGVPIVYGDAGRREVLQHIGVHKAGLMVIAISDPVVTRHTVAITRELNPGLHITVRTRYLSDVEELLKLGATEVVPEEFGTSIEIFTRVLAHYGMTQSAIENEVADIRSTCYQALEPQSKHLSNSFSRSSQG